jgi:hypothetical protein
MLPRVDHVQVPRDPATVVLPREGARPEHEVAYVTGASFKAWKGRQK